MKTLTMKFGGTSVGSVESISNLVTIVQREITQDNRVVVVVSAMSGVTDLLLSSVRMAIEGDKWGYISIGQKLRDRHEDTLNQLLSSSNDREQVVLKINKLMDEFVELCNAITILGEATPRIFDLVTTYGERCSSLLVSAVLRENGINSQAFNAGNFIITDDNHQSATPLWDITTHNIETKLLPIIDDGVTPVITGFIGATEAGVPTTLGRGGSDFSGAIFAAYTRSDELVIWTDVDGVMTTDPRIDRRAKVLPQVSYQEVGELAFYGAKVLHPKTVQPILNAGIPLRVRNTFNIDHPGTLISEEALPSMTVIKAITNVRNVSMLTISGRGMLGVPGIAGRTFLATSRVGANILMISQSSSEQSFCFIVTDEHALSAQSAVEEELALDISRRNVDGVDLMSHIAIVTVVGSGMRGTPGVSGRVFTALGEERINVLSIAQGSSECSISFVIDESDLERAVTTLHDLALEAVPTD